MPRSLHWFETRRRAKTLERAMTRSSDRPEKPTNKMTLVVGATGRLGVAIARALVARGDRVALTARDPNKLEALSKELNSAPFVVADLMKPDAVDTIVEGLRKNVGPIDDVILACGPFPRTPFDTLSREDLFHTLTVHAVAPLLLVS